jgi:hypothetical protein
MLMGALNMVLRIIIGSFLLTCSWLADLRSFVSDIQNAYIYLYKAYFGLLPKDDPDLLFMDKAITAFATLYFDNGQTSPLSLLYIDPVYPMYYAARSRVKSAAAVCIRTNWLKFRSGQVLSLSEKGTTLGSVMIFIVDTAFIVGVAVNPIVTLLNGLGLIDVPAFFMAKAVSWAKPRLVPYVDAITAKYRSINFL